jgi:hypothetical protein
VIIENFYFVIKRAVLFPSAFANKKAGSGFHPAQ